MSASSPLLQLPWLWHPPCLDIQGSELRAVTHRKYAGIVRPFQLDVASLSLPASTTLQCCPSSTIAPRCSARRVQILEDRADSFLADLWLTSRTRVMSLLFSSSCIASLPPGSALYMWNWARATADSDLRYAVSKWWPTFVLPMIADDSLNSKNIGDTIMSPRELMMTLWPDRLNSVKNFPILGTASRSLITCQVSWTTWS